jgi:serralysin
MAITPAPLGTYTKANIPNYENVYINGLIWTLTRWGSGSGVSPSYSFPQDKAYYNTGGSDVPYFVKMTQATQTVITNQIINQFASVANITLTEITETSTDHADIHIAFSTKNAVSDPTITGQASTPGNLQGGDVWLAEYMQNNEYKPGTDAFQNVLHELGHAFDLKHPHLSDTITGSVMPLEHDTQAYSVMSYVEYRNIYMIARGNTGGHFRAKTLMLDDIRALQYIYGPNFNSKSGKTTYTWDPGSGELTTVDTAPNGQTTTSKMTPDTGVNKILMTVWDGGGEDTYDFHLYTTGVTVNLQPGAWTTTAANQLPSYDVPFGPPATAPGNIANAYLRRRAQTR